MARKTASARPRLCSKPMIIQVAKRHRLILICVAPDNLKDRLVRVMRGLVIEQFQRLPRDVPRLRGLREHGEIVALELSQLWSSRFSGSLRRLLPDNPAQLD